MTTPSSKDPAPTTLMAVKAVLWGFLGVRGKAGYEEDVKKLRPLQVIVIGLIGAALFVGALVTVVSFVTSAQP